MNIEKQRARLIRRIVVLEVIQDFLNAVAGLFGTVSAFFANLGQSAKIAEVDLAKQYRDLTGSVVRESDGSLGPVAVEDDED